MKVSSKFYLLSLFISIFIIGRLSADPVEEISRFIYELAKEINSESVEFEGNLEKLVKKINLTIEGIVSRSSKVVVNECTEKELQSITDAIAALDAKINLMYKGIMAFLASESQVGIDSFCVVVKSGVVNAFKLLSQTIRERLVPIIREIDCEVAHFIEQDRTIDWLVFNVQKLCNMMRKKNEASKERKVLRSYGFLNQQLDPKKEREKLDLAQKALQKEHIIKVKKSKPTRAPFWSSDNRKPCFFSGEGKPSPLGRVCSVNGKKTDKKEEGIIAKTPRFSIPAVIDPKENIRE